MEHPNHRVKIACNHLLEYAEMEHLTHVRIIENKSDISSLECIGCGKKSGKDYGYFCWLCEYWAHQECLEFPNIIKPACHSRHPLKKVSTETIGYTDGTCHFCRDELGDEMYHCSICNFSIDLKCSRNLPPRTVYRRRSHNHTFTLMARMVSFTCNACGMVGDRNPYVCLKCDYMLHQKCITLPRVININRHEHRVSRTYRLYHGDWECGVCREEMEWTFGAFYCKRCPGYAVHSKCATRTDVWDGKELEDEPEEEEVPDPYKVINEKEILHFSHGHNLRLGGDDDNVTDYEKMLCDACMLPINFDPFFKCVQCEFFLHKVCASLPRKRRNILHNHRLTLVPYFDGAKPFRCGYCLQFFDGFSYRCPRANGICSIITSPCDVRCGTISEPFHHELHPHPLYRTSCEHKTCGACGQDSEYVLSCTVCEFALGMECAMLPRKVKHRCDDHVLSLHHGAGNSTGQLWCDICEGKTDPSVWFYGCDDCGTTLHIKCVIGDMYYLKQGKTYDKGELVPNNSMFRPVCFVCGNRCLFPSFLKGVIESASTVVYACSKKCADTDKWEKKELSLEEISPGQVTDTGIPFQFPQRRRSRRSYMVRMYHRYSPLLRRILLYLTLFLWLRFFYILLFG